MFSESISLEKYALKVNKTLSLEQFHYKSGKVS